MKNPTQRHGKVLALLTLLTLVVYPLLLSTSTFAQAKKPITKDGMIEAIRLKGFTTKELIKQIETRGVSFEMTTEVEAQLVTAGARPEIIQAARTNYRSVGILNVTATVPGTEITVSGNGSSIDRVTDMKLQPGRYEIVGKLLNYRTATRQVEIKAGETSDIKLELDPLKKEATPTEVSAKPVKPKPSRDASATELVFWESIKDSNNVDDFKSYLEKYPDGPFAALAKNKINSRGASPRAESKATSDAAEIAFWDSIKNSKSAADLRAYLEKYPNGEFAVLAKSRLAPLEAEEKEREKAAEIAKDTKSFEGIFGVWLPMSGGMVGYPGRLLVSPAMVKFVYDDQTKKPSMLGCSSFGKAQIDKFFIKEIEYRWEYCNGCSKSRFQAGSPAEASGVLEEIRTICNLPGPPAKPK